MRRRLAAMFRLFFLFFLSLSLLFLLSLFLLLRFSFGRRSAFSSRELEERLRRLLRLVITIPRLLRAETGWWVMMMIRHESFHPRKRNTPKGIHPTTALVISRR